MLRESLPEYIGVARFAVESQKPGGGGVYGYPAALLLFSVVDAIGSHCRGDRKFTALVDCKNRTITNDNYHHFFVLNSVFYEQTLPERQIRALYKAYRNPLTHNACLLPGVLLAAREPSSAPVFYPHEDNNSIECVNLRGFLELSERAVQRFLERTDDAIDGSHQAKLTMQKGDPAPVTQQGSFSGRHSSALPVSRKPGRKK